MIDFTTLSSALTRVAAEFKSDPGAINFYINSNNAVKAHVSFELINSIAADAKLVVRKYDNGSMPYEVQKEVSGVIWFAALNIEESIRYMQENDIPIPEMLRGEG